MKLSLAQALTVNNAIKNTPFKGTAVIDAAINLVNLSVQMKVIDEIRIQLLGKHNNGEENFEKGSAKLTEFLAAFEECLKKDCEVVIKTIKLSSVDESRLSNHESLAELLKLGVIQDIEEKK